MKHFKAVVTCLVLSLVPIPSAATSAQGVATERAPASVSIPAGFVLKFHEGTGVRLHNGFLLPLESSLTELSTLGIDEERLALDLATIQTAVELHSPRLALQRLFSAPEGVLASRRALSGPCGASDRPDLNLYYLLRTRGATLNELADLLREIAALASVEEMYPQAQAWVPSGGGIKLRLADGTVVGFESQFPDHHNLADAVNRAAIQASRLDATGTGMILIQAQLYSLVSDDILALPIEHEPAIFDAIQDATCHGISVVEAAGDGALNLDSPELNGEFDRDLRDSQAVLVAARLGAASLATASTNWGQRIDVHGVGEGLDSTAQAVSIIAENVAAIQRHRVDLGLATFDPESMRDYLVATGRRKNSDPKPIGTLPDATRDVENSPPLAADDELSVPVDATSISINYRFLLENDNDPDEDQLHMAGFVQEPLHGKLTTGFGGFTYFPDAGFVEAGNDSFSYTVQDRADGTGLESIATVVLGFNRPPVATDDLVWVPPGSETLQISLHDLTRNDTDPDGDTFWVHDIMTTSPQYGSLKKQRRYFSYTPAPEFWRTCEDHFTYRTIDRKDDTGAISAAGTVSLRCQQLFADDFESPDLGAWSHRAANGGAFLEPTAQAALHGRVGLAVTLTENPAAAAFLVDQTPSSVDQYRAHFIFDASGLDIPESVTLQIFDALHDELGQSVFELRVRKDHGMTLVQARFHSSDFASDWLASRWEPIAAGPVELEVGWWAASVGGLTLRIDGRLVETLYAPNALSRIDQARLGALESSADGTRGTLYFDQFESFLLGP